MTPRTARITAQTLGLSLVAAGVAFIHWQSSLIVVGVVLFAFAIHATIWSTRGR